MSWHLSRTIIWLSLWLSLIPRMARAGNGVDDFSNNLASDVGPLLALFGESMTIQYLSEMTSMWDYLIFAMGPVGIITAIVSVIRVCGGITLRAFVGRAREGEGEVEAELCTSTSRDVCELFDAGGIIRVMGKPKLLEIICHPSQPGKGRNTKQNRWHIEMLQDYLLRTPPEDQHQWREVDHSNDNQAQTSREEWLRWYANPNLSLNVGIVNPSRWWFRFVALTGILLQSGVIMMAALLWWKFRWTTEGKSTDGLDPLWTPKDVYAVFMFMLGSGLLCAGMFWCAFLIGQYTHERTFERSDNRSRIFWLQPGNQVLGDQTFGSSAYTEKDGRQISQYRFSRKHPESKSTIATLFAVIMTLIGYIAQFIGLRGIHASVAIAQLGVSMIMSLLRGASRINRLSPRDNPFRKYPDLILGHELDWLAFEITQSQLQEDYAEKPDQSLVKGGTTNDHEDINRPLAWNWRINGMVLPAERVSFRKRKSSTLPTEALKPNFKRPSHEAPEAAQQELADRISIHDEPKNDEPLEDGNQAKEASAPTRDTSVSVAEVEAPNASPPNGGTKPEIINNLHPSDSAVIDVFRYRARLAQLTGLNIGNPERSASGDLENIQPWEDDQIAVRSLARSVSDAVCLTAKELIPKSKLCKALILKVGVTMSRMSPSKASENSSGYCEVELTAPNQLSPDDWSIDINAIEAVLGLWMWSLKTADRTH